MELSTQRAWKVWFFRCLLVAIFSLMAFGLTADEKVYRDGDVVVIDMGQISCVDQLRCQMESLFGQDDYFEKNPSKIALVVQRDEECSVAQRGQNLGYPRNFFAPLTQEQIEAMDYILDTLGNESLPSVYRQQDRLEAAGYTIDGVHPMVFLREAVSTDRRLTNLRNIRNRPIIWGDFAKGIKQSLKTEAQIHRNVHIEHVRAIAEEGEIEIHSILPYVQKQQWDEFLNALISTVPRKGNHKRYDS